MEEFDYRNFLVENKLTINSRLLSENETDLKKVEELFEIINNCLANFREYSTSKVLKYHFANRGHDTTDKEMKTQYDKIRNTPLHIILKNPSAYDYTGTSDDTIEIFNKAYYDKYGMVYTDKKDVSKLSEEDIKSAISGAYNFLSSIKEDITVQDVVGNEYRSYQIIKNDQAKLFQSNYKKLENLYKKYNSYN